MDCAALALHAGLDAILHLQHGLIRRDQALAAGISTSALNSLVARGRWVRVLPRVYAVETDPRAPEARLRAAWLWAGDDAVVTGAAAAWWWELTDRAPEVVDMVVPLSRRMTARPGVRIIRAALHPDEVSTHRRVSVTTPAATCLRLARTGDRDLIEVALRRGLPYQTLLSTLSLGAHRHGQPLAAQSCVEVHDNPWSHPERRLHALLREAAVTGWRANCPLAIDGRIYVPDLLFNQVKLIVEVDGRVAHGSRDQFEADRRRQNALVAAGWTVLRFTARQIAEEPGTVIRVICATLARLSAVR